MFNLPSFESTYDLHSSKKSNPRKSIYSLVQSTDEETLAKYQLLEQPNQEVLDIYTLLEENDTRAKEFLNLHPVKQLGESLVDLSLFELIESDLENKLSQVDIAKLTGELIIRLSLGNIKISSLIETKRVIDDGKFLKWQNEIENLLKMAMSLNDYTEMVANNRLDLQDLYRFLSNSYDLVNGVSGFLGDDYLHKASVLITFFSLLSTFVNVSKQPEVTRKI